MPNISSPIKSLALAACLCTTISAAAQTFEKNQLPCTVELCLGDGLAELASISWEKVTLDNKPETSQTLRDLREWRFGLQRKDYRGNLDAVLPYLDQNRFDKGALAGLARIKAACTMRELSGDFVTASGHKTTVVIALMPNLTDPSIQDWRVMQIRRLYPDGMSAPQREELTQTLNTRYQKWADHRRAPIIPTLGKPVFYVSNSNPLFFVMQMSVHESPFVELKDKHRHHPLCGGLGKVSAD